MKVIKQGLSLAVAVAGLAAVPGLQAHAAGSAPSAQPSLVQQMRTAARGDVAASVERSTGKVGFIHATGQGDLLPTLEGGSRSAAADKADAYLQKYAPAFGATWDQLHRTGTVSDRYGYTVTYTQSYHGVPVFGSELKANLDTEGDLTSVNGFAVPDISMSTSPRFTASQAAERAVATVKADPPTDEDGSPAAVRGLRVTSNDLVVYREGAVKGQPGPSVLAYEVQVGNGSDVRDVVILDANTNKPVNRYSEIADNLERHLVEANGSTNPGTFTEVWKEGDAFPGALNQDQQNEVRGTGDAYWFFKDTFGRDSYDAAGHSMTTVNNDGRINCPNANWNGATTNYCNGVTSDDVVAHEWGHAYTEYTSGLIYQWQSGAMNEAYSDIWGETVDLINGRLDEGEGDLTVKRPVGQCSTHTGALPVVLINSPASIAKLCFAGAAAFGPQLTATGITNDVVQAMDDAADGSGTNGCTAITNGTAVTGKIALIDRGTCGFAIKTKNAQNAGAIAVVIGNTVDAVNGMAGSDPSITIPAVMVKKSDRDRIVGALGSGAVNLTLKDNTSTDKVDSYRWLMGEKSSAFGGAIRDMWTPTCYGDPGKVSDAEYYCATDDNGGVHSNSGVVNHSYALLVDGGTYNGVSVTGLGLDKAANIYFRAQVNYLTPTSDFADLADSLQASCTDLVGAPINKVKLTDDGTSEAATPITAADCGSVAAVANAVELRKAPVQCNFQPILAKNAPGVCGTGTITKTDWSENFESGLASWTTSSELTYPVGKHFDWVATSQNVPGDHAGSVAFAVDPNTGSCGGDANDISSRDSIASPAVTFPTGQSPRLVFDHYVASEAGWDGGNVKVSVNDGAFTQVPNAAYVFNAPNSALNTAAAGNTGPMAGQPAWTGTDGGEPTGSWGQSQVDLSALSAVPGDSLKFRFDFGRDGCGGIDGWYVDNVKVVHCQQVVAANVQASHTPEPAAFGKAHSVDVTVTGEGTPSGTVTVAEGGTTLGSAALANGHAAVSLPTTMAVGTHDLTVTYSGDSANGRATTHTTATITKAASTTTATHTPEPAVIGQAHSVDVTVTGEGTPTGTVTVTEGTTVLGSADLVKGAASISLPTTMAVGTHSLTVTYSGDAANAGSSTSTTATITKAASLTSATGSPNPVKVGKTIKATVVVTAPGTTPTGTVRIYTGGTKVGTGTLVDGKVVISITKDFPAGKRTFVAKYSGSATLAASADTFSVKIVK